MQSYDRRADLSTPFSSVSFQPTRGATLVYFFYFLAIIYALLLMAKPSLAVDEKGQNIDAPQILRLGEAKQNSALISRRTLSLKASFEKAYDNNKELIAAKYNLPIAKAGIQIAGAIPNPQFSMLYGFGPAFTVILAGNPQQFGLQEQILTAGVRTKQLNLARAKYKLAELQVFGVLFDIHNQVRRAYSELAAAESYADLIEEQRKMALELVRIAESHHQNKNTSDLDLLQAQLGVLQFDIQRNQAQARLQKATASLSLLIGEIPAHIEVMDVDDNGIFKLSAQHNDLVPSPDQVLPSLEQLLPLAYKTRADLQVAIQQAFVDRRALSLARAQRVPNLSVDCGYQFTTFKRVQPYNLFSGSVPNSPGCYLNIATEAPIFYQYQGETTQAKEIWLQDFEQIDQLKKQIAADIVGAYTSVIVTRANITKFQQQLIPTATEVASQTRHYYETGKGSIGGAILAKQQYQQILSSYFEAVVSYQNAWADLEKAMGVPLQL